MKVETNIYDIDGELIRQFGDNHEVTIEEAQNKINYYKQLLDSVDGTTKQAATYATYIRNLSAYVLQQLAKQAQKPKQTTEEQVQNAINELRQELENDENTGVRTEDEVPTEPTDNTEDNSNDQPGNDPLIYRGDSDVSEDNTVSQDDLLVERDDEAPVMEEYVSYDAVPYEEPSEETSEEPEASEETQEPSETPVEE